MIPAAPGSAAMFERKKPASVPTFGHGVMSEKLAPSFVERSRRVSGALPLFVVANNRFAVVPS